MKKETTLDDVLEAVNIGFDAVQERFGTLQGEISEAREEMDTRFTTMHERMATKDDIARLDRRMDKTDGKLNTLINVLEKKDIITNSDKKTVLT